MNVYLHSKIHLHLFLRTPWWHHQHRMSVQPVKERKTTWDQCGPFYYRSISNVPKTFWNINFLLSFDEFEMLCLLLQINVMHLEHVNPAQQIATVNASDVLTLKTGLQHIEHVSNGILETTLTKHSIYTVNRREIDTKDQTEEGRCLVQTMHGAGICDYQG